jgi:hypothetical protein
MYTVDNWSNWCIGTSWTPIFITANLNPNTFHPPGVYPNILNISFLLFWVILAVNLYFIISLQKSKETKQASF